MTTEQHLAAAATHLGVLLEHGQQDLATRPVEAAIVAHTRDQVAANLAHVLRTAATHLDVLDQGAAAHRAAAVSRALGLRRTGLPGPAPTQTAIDPPTSRSAQAWLGAALEVEVTAVQASRAGHLSADVWRASVADTSALVAALAWADVDLGRALVWSDVNPLVTAGRMLLDGARVDGLRRDALEAMAAMDAAGLPQEYHLQAPVRGAVPVSEPGQIPAALRRAGEVLRQGPSLTGRQHRAGATALAAIAHRLQLHVRRAVSDGGSAGVDDRLASALTRYANAQLLTAGAWQRATHLWCAQPGSWDVAAQLSQTARLLGEPTEQGVFTPELVRAAARELPGIGASASDNFGDALVREHWLAAYDGRTGTQWATLWPDFEPVRPQSAPLPGPDDLATRQAWRAAGIPVRGYQVGARRDEGLIASPRGLQELTRIQDAQELTRTAGHALTGAVGPLEPVAVQGIPDSARIVLGGTAALQMAVPDATALDAMAGLGEAAAARSPGIDPGVPVHLTAEDVAPHDGLTVDETHAQGRGR